MSPNHLSLTHVPFLMSPNHLSPTICPLPMDLDMKFCNIRLHFLPPQFVLNPDHSWGATSCYIASPRDIVNVCVVCVVCVCALTSKVTMVLLPHSLDALCCLVSCQLCLEHFSPLISSKGTLQYSSCCVHLHTFSILLHLPTLSFHVFHLQICMTKGCEALL